MSEGDEQLQPEKVVVTITPELHDMFRAADKAFMRVFLDEGQSIENTLVAITALHQATADAYREQLAAHRKVRAKPQPDDDLTNIEPKGNA